jgi:hypothetical protein
MLPKLLDNPLCFPGTPRAFVFTHHSAEFNSCGLAVTEYGKRISRSVYQSALGALQKEIDDYSRQTGDDTKLIGVFGSYIKKSARWGVYPLNIEYTGALRLEKDKQLFHILDHMGMDGGSEDYLQYPSDLDLIVNKAEYEKFEAMRAEVCTRIFADYGVLATLSPQCKETPFRPIEDYLPS